MKWLFTIICSILIFSGCCGSEVVLRKIAVDIPELVDTVEAETLRQAQGDRDSLGKEIGYRGISFKEGSKDTAAIAEFIPGLKKFVIKIPGRVDTVFIRDTIRVKPTDLILRGNDNSERIIWIISFILTTIFIMIYKGYLNVRNSKKQA